MTLRRGEPAPDLTLGNQDGRDVSLALFRGRNVIVHFFPQGVHAGLHGRGLWLP